jgi:hypothetical protein
VRKKKVRRVVLGEGYPYLWEVATGAPTISLYDDVEKFRPSALFRGPLLVKGRKIRLVAEIL